MFLPALVVLLGAAAVATKAQLYRARLAVKGIVERGAITSMFGPRGPEGVHAGIDIAAPEGSPVLAAADGVIVDLSPDGERSGYGNTVIVDHGDRTLTLYAHMQDIAPGLVLGQRVTEGALLGHVGKTHAPETRYMLPHLHFETHRGKGVDEHGRLIVNPDFPPRMDPVIWLARRRKRITDKEQPSAA